MLRRENTKERRRKRKEEKVLWREKNDKGENRGGRKKRRYQGGKEGHGRMEERGIGRRWKKKREGKSIKENMKDMKEVRKVEGEKE